MDLTNIKPCVKCAKWDRCISCLDIAEMARVRICKCVVVGMDCFEEGDNNA